MRQKDGQGAEAFTDPGEMLYRRCPADCIGEDSRVLDAAVKELNLSVLRSMYAEPDDARWDSKVACEEMNREPKVYPELYVIEFAVGSIPPEKPPEMPGASAHTFRAVHVPFPDNYAHSEVRIYQGNKFLAKDHDLSKGEGKLAKKYLRWKIAEAARVRLRPYEQSPLAGTNAAWNPSHR